MLNYRCGNRGKIASERTGSCFARKNANFQKFPQQTDNQLFTTYNISTDIPPSCNNACFSP